MSRHMTGREYAGSLQQAGAVLTSREKSGIPSMFRSMAALDRALGIAS